MSAIVLGALPLGMMAFMYVSNPGWYLDPLLERQQLGFCWVIPWSRCSSGSRG
ncbi:MAG: hypothetical protein R2704_09640 [Microthrixaceae bacterium]